MAVGLIRLLVRRPGTHCQLMNSDIQLVMMLKASNSALKQSRSVFTVVTSALEVNFNVMHYINSCFTLLYFTLLRKSAMQMTIRVFKTFCIGPTAVLYCSCANGITNSFRP